MKKLDIIYEDKYILVVNKPAGLLTISTQKESINTLYKLIEKYKSCEQITTSNKHCSTRKMHSEFSFSISSAVPVVEKGALLNFKAAIP